MSRRKQTKTDVLLMFSLEREGMKQKDIAKRIGCRQSTVSKILSRFSTPHIPVHNCTADRYEYFLGDEARNTGNLLNGHPMYNPEDPTFEEVAFWEEIEREYGT